MNITLSLSVAAIAVSSLCLLTYILRGRRQMWLRRCSALSAAVSGILLLLILGVIRPLNTPRKMYIDSCTALVMEHGVQRVEKTCTP